MRLKILLNKFFIVIFMLLLFSCKSRGDRLALGLYYDDIKPKTMMSEVIKKYGKNYRKWRDGNGYQVLEYSHCQSHYDLLSFLPLPITKPKFDNYEIILTFDKNNRLITVKKFHDRLISLPLAICEPDIADCNLEYKVIERR